MTSTSIKTTRYELVSESKVSIFLIWSQFIISITIVAAFLIACIVFMVRSFSMQLFITTVLVVLFCSLVLYIKYRFLFYIKTIHIDSRNLQVLISDAKSPEQFERVPYTNVTSISKTGQNLYTIDYRNELNQTSLVEFFSRDFMSKGKVPFGFNPEFNITVKHLDSEIRRAKKNNQPQP